MIEHREADGKRQLTRRGRRLRNVVVVIVLIAVLSVVVDGHRGANAPSYRVGDVSSSLVNPSTLLVTFNITNTGSAAGTPSCTIGAAGLLSERVPMKPIKSGNVEIVPGYPFQVTAAQGAKTNVKVACSTHRQSVPEPAGKPSYRVSELAVTPLGNTVLELTFQLTNSGAAPGTPDCMADVKGSRPQTVDLQGPGSVLSPVLDPRVTDFVKDAAIVASSAKSINLAEVRLTCRALDPSR
ncbi:MAG: hypothetical protein ACYCXY_10595 [Acidimicrobiales bacterium]